MGERFRTNEELVRLLFRIPKSLHTQLDVLAAKHRKSLQLTMINMIELGIKAHEEQNYYDLLHSMEKGSFNDL